MSVRRNAGFTLIEMCLVVTLLGVLVSVAWPSFQSLHGRFVMESATRELIDCMAFARASAVAERCRYQLRWERSPWSYSLYRFAGTDEQGRATAEPAADRWKKKRELSREILMETQQDMINFFSDGSTSAAKIQMVVDGRAPTTLELSGTFGYVQAHE